MLVDCCKAHHNWHECQIESRRQCSAIDAVARVIQRVQDTRRGGKLAGMLLMEVKEAFDHISRNGLKWKMEALGANGDLVGWTGSFMLERSLSFIIAR